MGWTVRHIRPPPTTIEAVQKEIYTREYREKIEAFTAELTSPGDDR